LAGYQDFVHNAYVWLFIGILFRLPSLAGPPLEDHKLSNKVMDERLLENLPCPREYLLVIGAAGW
jgi:hypothetical protein